MNINNRRGIVGTLTLLALWCVAVAAQPSTLRGKVVGIADGDTLTVLDARNTQHRIRLSGIDAPESRQAFGTRSRQHLADLVFGKQVTVEYEKQDRYGRTLGKVLVDGRDANLEQITAGFAWHYKYYENEQPLGDRKTYAESEVEARAAKRGLWVDPNPTPPWDFRRGRRGATSGAAANNGEPPAERNAPRSAPRTGERPSPAGAPRVRAREPEAERVYVTRTGGKYHRAGCRYLRRSQIPVLLEDARQGYTPCSICRPPG